MHTYMLYKLCVSLPWINTTAYFDDKSLQHRMLMSMLFFHNLRCFNKLVCLSRAFFQPSQIFASKVLHNVWIHTLLKILDLTKELVNDKHSSLL